MTTLRRGHGSSYKQDHPHIAPAPTTWTKRCARCNAPKEPGDMKRHRVYGYVCAVGCKR